MAQFSCAAFQNLQLEVADQHNFIVPVAVNVVNLKGQIVGEQPVARIGAAQLPKNFSIEGDSGKTTDLVVGIARDPGNVLPDKHVENAVAIQIAEADAASGAEVRGRKLLP